MLQDAMRQEEEEQGGEGHKVCRSDDCQCVVDGEFSLHFTSSVSSPLQISIQFLYGF